MYKHILLPTDGSTLSQHAILSGLHLAKAIGACVTGIYVTPKVFMDPLDSWAHGDVKASSHLRRMFENQAWEYLTFIERASENAGVDCHCVQVSANAPYEAILKTAETNGCDLIFMASHGQKGSSALVLGSETVKVLTHSPIPVMVHRETTAARQNATTRRVPHSGDAHARR